MGTTQRVVMKDCIGGMKELVPDGSVDMTFADPPFGINYDETSQMYGYGVTRDANTFYDDSMNDEEYGSFSRSWISEVYRASRDQGIFVLMTGWNHLSELDIISKSIGFKPINHAIWGYEFGVYTKRKYATSHYHYLIYVKGSTKKKYTFNVILKDREKYKIDVFKGLKDAMTIEDEKESIRKIARIVRTILIDDRDEFTADDFFDHLHRLSKRYVGIIHPCKLSEDVIGKFIGEWSNEGDMVMDPFVGSGTSLVAASNLNRNYIGFEKGKVDEKTGTEIYGWGIVEMVKRRLIDVKVKENKDILSFIK